MTTPLDALRMDLAYAQALRLALEANADKLDDPAERDAARKRAGDIYRLNASTANRIYYRAITRLEARTNTSQQTAGTPSLGPAIDAGWDSPSEGAIRQQALNTRRTA